MDGTRALYMVVMGVALLAIGGVMGFGLAERLSGLC